MPSLEALAEFWADEGLDHIIPKTGEEFPEGFDVYEILNRLINPAKGVLEIGCGYGRLCRAFPGDRYTGVDVNPKAIAAAQERNPGYKFQHVMPGGELPKAGTALLYTVACHIPDEELGRFLAPICEAAPVVVIAEIMDIRWRRSGNPPIFNRDPEQYALEMQNRGFLLWRFGKANYERYNKPPWNSEKETRLTFHQYARATG